MGGGLLHRRRHGSPPACGARGILHPVRRPCSREVRLAALSKCVQDTDEMKRGHARIPDLDGSRPRSVSARRRSADSRSDGRFLCAGDTNVASAEVDPRPASAARSASYTHVYCARGDSENPFKELKLALAFGRTSSRAPGPISCASRPKDALEALRSCTG